MQIQGLPAHPLLVHAVVIGLPLTALAVVLAAVWPAARRRIGVLAPLAALVVLALVPVTVSAGRSLVRQVGAANPAVSAHARLGGTLLPWAVGLAVAAVAVWVLGRVRDRAGESALHAGGGPGAARGDGAPHGPRTILTVLTVVVAVLAVVVAVGATWQVVEIGESGARAVWGAPG